MTELKFSIEKEKKFWRASPGLEGKVVSFGNLQDTFLASSQYGLVNILTRTDKFNVYGRDVKGDTKTTEGLAYLCKSCDQIVIGAPEIKQINGSLDDYSLSCRVCDSLLYEYRKT